jgi:hypothetical protein
MAGAALVGAARWLVEIARQRRYFATPFASDPAGAAELRDEPSAQLHGGSPFDVRPTAA